MKTINRKKMKELKLAPSKDVIRLILADHKPLKKLIKTLKRERDIEMSEKEKAFKEFARLLTAHAKAEDQSLYIDIKTHSNLKLEGLGADIEHGIAERLLEDTMRTKDEDLWNARIKVLVELVDHHIKEEESELLPKYRKNSEVDDRVEIGEYYKVLREELLQNENSPKKTKMSRIFQENYESQAT